MTCGHCRSHPVRTSPLADDHRPRGRGRRRDQTDRDTPGRARTGRTATASKTASHPTRTKRAAPGRDRGPAGTLRAEKRPNRQDRTGARPRARRGRDAPTGPPRRGPGPEPRQGRRTRAPRTSDNDARAARSTRDPHIRHTLGLDQFAASTPYLGVPSAESTRVAKELLVPTTSAGP